MTDETYLNLGLAAFQGMNLTQKKQIDFEHKNRIMRLPIGKEKDEEEERFPTFTRFNAQA